MKLKRILWFAALFVGLFAIGNTTQNVYAKAKCTKHSYQWVFEKKPTCTKNGIKRQKCTKCGYQPTSSVVSLSKLGHKYEWKTTIKATCTSTGKKEQKCTRCGNVKSTKTIAKTAHDYKTHIDTANCEHGKESYQICEKCKKIKPDSKKTLSKPNAHQFKKSDKSVCQCKVCGLVKKHKWKWTSGVTKKCTLCGAVEKE